MKILAVIANHGAKNHRFVVQLIDTYRAMTHQVDVVILSNIDKNLGPDVRVIVGFPDPSDPWSLPFGYKKLFKDHRDDYDLFIYSEDDTLITEENVRAFIEVSAHLREDEIAGFIRYEIGPDKTFYYSTIHGPYFWDPASIRRRGPYVLAHYTNDHSGAFIVARAQLHRAIAAGAMDSPPRKGLYDMLCTAATEPYTGCGLTKLVPVSHIESFRFAHLPNIYLGRIGVRGEEMDIQFARILQLADAAPDGAADAIEYPGQLFQTRNDLDSIEWDKSYFEPRRDDILAIVPPAARTVLSVGCGWGKTEEALVASGRRVCAIPLDAVIEASARSRGVETLPPDFSAAFSALAGRRFDCIYLLEVLEHLPDPQPLIERLAPHLAPGGLLIVGLYHFGDLGSLKRLWKGDPAIADIRAIRDFDRLRFRPLPPARIRRWMADCGLTDLQTTWPIPETRRKYAVGLGRFLGRWLARGVLVTGTCRMAAELLRPAGAAATARRAEATASSAAWRSRA